LVPRSGFAGPRPPGAVLRAIAFGIAVVSGAVAIWLIVTSQDQKRLEIGILLGLWGLLLGAFAVFGSKSREQPPVPMYLPSPPGQELDLRQLGEIERAAVANAVATARREFQSELEDMLRREMQAGLAHEVAEMRAEVTALRNDLVEKVGGQLRLERIETTRLIGSDLEALQQELRELREIGGGRPTDDDGHDVQDAEIVVERIDLAPPAPAPAPEPPPQREPEPEPEPVAVEPEPEPEPVAVEPEPEPAPAVAAVEPEPAPPAASVIGFLRKPEPAAAKSGDPFASMPRIRPFTDFELDPIPASNGEPPAEHPARHASGGDDTASQSRRHRAEDGTDDVLARILERESRH
jgi:hypothetical protein